LGRRGGADVVVGVNAQSMARDIKEVTPGGCFVYDSTKPLDLRMMRDDILFVGLPLTEICLQEYSNPALRQLFKNIIYVGALAALLDMDFNVLTAMVEDQFKGKEKLIAPNIHALELGYGYTKQHYSCPLGLRLETRDLVKDAILVDGNSACGLGAVFAGATVAGWYPITPSTSVIDAFGKYAKRLRIDAASGANNFAIVQAEDELAAIGMVIGASWNGARAFTATSGPGVSLMSEFLGLAYFAEIPLVLIDVQRSGPSTGMPTRTQQSDILSAAYASHGDTKQVLIIPSTPKECFDFTALSFDLAERIQTPIIMMTDLDLGMNDNMSQPFSWDDARKFDRGKVMTAEMLDASSERFGRYLDVDGDGVCYRTYPGTHPTKGAFFTRGTSRDEYAVYTEDGDEYVANMQRLERKWQTAKTLMPKPELYQQTATSPIAMLFYGTSKYAAEEALDYFRLHHLEIDAICIKAFPFSDEVAAFIDDHQQVFVIEQNRDGQMRSLIINELETNPAKLLPVLNYDGMPLTASFVVEKVSAQIENTISPLTIVPVLKEA
jgi:2-oxoglutarate ferredoxin oxidoreductase subunit alpha